MPINNIAVLHTLSTQKMKTLRFSGFWITTYVLVLSTTLRFDARSHFWWRRCCSMFQIFWIMAYVLVLPTTLRFDARSLFWWRRRYSMFKIFWITAYVLVLPTTLRFDARSHFWWRTRCSMFSNVSSQRNPSLPFIPPTLMWSAYDGA